MAGTYCNDDDYYQWINGTLVKGHGIGTVWIPDEDSYGALGVYKPGLKPIVLPQDTPKSFKDNHGYEITEGNSIYG